MTTLESTKKPLSAIDNNIVNVFHLISFHRDKPIILGSNQYKNLRYPADYDLFEVIHEGQNKEKFITECIKIFQQIIHNIMDERDLYFIDFKTEDRLHNKIRWKPKNILFLNGHIKSKISLHDVIADATNHLIKIDVIYYHNGLFIEFSNIFCITSGDKKKDIIDELQSIADDVTELVSEGNYFKALKRLYSIAQIKKNKECIKILFDIFNTDLGKLSQIISYINSIVLVLERYSDKETLERAHDSINHLKSMMVLPELNLKNTIFDKFEDISKQTTADNIIISSGHVIKSLNKILQTKAKVIYEKVI